MKAMLDGYPRPYDPRYPLIGRDEVSKQLLRDTRAPHAVTPGQVQRIDFEYAREGVVNLFLFCEPLRGQRWVKVTNRRTKVDWAHQITELVDVRDPHAERIVLVMDNLNTHGPASRYAVFPPAEAKRLADKLEIHSTPKHGSWRAPSGHWPKSNCVSSVDNASTGAFPTPRRSSPKDRRGKRGAMPPTGASSGASLRQTHGSNSRSFTLHLTSNRRLGAIIGT